MEERIESLFNDIDSMDADKFVSYLDEDVVFKFGNAPETKGKEETRQAVDGFFKSIKGISHRKIRIWIHPDSIIYQGSVTYTRHDDSVITLPYLNLFLMKGEMIIDYKIYMDVNPLFSGS
ncbi:MAG TPA: nuclear transport factor 2 family protein [Ignavibacteria bacterium]|nr:nuclear transport factor 2 family protein [Ignavibacteria bacterium]HMR40248.1 nuclear transport factor 2 family protein [Ignavibacteria bacterium]